MKFVEPKIYLVSEPSLNYHQIFNYLNDVGADDFLFEELSRDAANLVEVMGRTCYRSFSPGLNKNVTKIRKDQKEYIKNIIDSGHHSVLEHVNVSFVFKDVSRALTHELVRHRIGVAYSQESLRYVALDNLSAYLPEAFKGTPYETMMVEAFTYLETLQSSLYNMAEMEGRPFHEKKALTSAFRRMAPMGLTTTIGVTMNMRELRFVICKRTEEGAEEEIRKVFQEVYRLLMEKEGYSVFLQDLTMNEKGEVVKCTS